MAVSGCGVGEGFRVGVGVALGWGLGVALGGWGADGVGDSAGAQAESRVPALKIRMAKIRVERLTFVF